MNPMKVCQHCRVPFELASTGRPPTYCSSTCRKNAWQDAKTRQQVEAAVAAERRRIADALGLTTEAGGPA
ncbi:hypothetical protein ACFVOB_35940 [Streptomyces rochei]|uniref:hypothetical protein n=1 Tax=Streptomyces rochei TaxID=1928 RepID=UPI0036B9CEA1